MEAGVIFIFSVACRNTASCHPGHASLLGLSRVSVSTSLLPIFVVLVILPFFFPPFSIAQDQASEVQVKAAFLFHFAQLVEWPPDSLSPPNIPVNFCVWGEEPLPSALQTIVEGKLVGTHSIHVRRLPDTEDLRSCHLLFIAGADSRRVIGILTSVKDAPVLTVGESEDFAKEGGMIGLSLEENKIRFDINLKAAQHVNLKISSRLLLLARKVIGEQS
jgi:hypothetical protein